jgi:hypothetical protein
MKLSKKPAASPSSALALAVDPPLDAAQRKVLAEALRRAEETRDVMEDALVAYGRWLLVQVFDDDAGAALAGRHHNPVWRALLARAGGPTLRVSERMLYVALHIAARDKRITDEAWRNLEPGRKELLLPLGDEAVMRRAAQHVTAMKLTQRATRAYVSALLAEAGGERPLRLTPRRVVAQVRTFRERVTRAQWSRRAADVLGAGDDQSRTAARKELEALRDWAESLLQGLPKKPAKRR